MELILNYKPDLVFLDVEMPDRDGFAVLNKIPEEARPFVIFVTAHDRFALKAFGCVNFLAKPECKYTKMKRSKEEGVENVVGHSVMTGGQNFNFLFFHIIVLNDTQISY